LRPVMTFFALPKYISPTENLELFFSRCSSIKRLSFNKAITTSLGVELIINSWFTRLIFCPAQYRKYLNASQLRAQKSGAEYPNRDD
jgi:hypothetical protein